MKRMRIAFVGAGNRVRKIYLPVLQALEQQCLVVGVTTRSRTSGVEAEKTLGCPWYDSISKLTEATQPDLLMVSVPPQNNAAAATQALATGYPTLLETPLALNLPEAQAVTQLANSSNTQVAVVEQKPFLPYEIFKRQLIDSGALGRVTVVQNDFRAYDYHAIAQLRRYLSPTVQPATAQAVSAFCHLETYMKQPETSPPHNGATGRTLASWQRIVQRRHTTHSPIYKYFQDRSVSLASIFLAAHLRHSREPRR